MQRDAIGAWVRNGGSLVLLRSTLTGGVSDWWDGCAWIEPQATLRLEESHVRGCVVNTTAQAVGGAVFNDANGHRLCSIVWCSAV